MAEEQQPELNIPDSDPIESKPVALGAPRASGAVRFLLFILVVAVLALAAAVAGLVHLGLQEKQGMLDRQQILDDKAANMQQRFKQLVDENYRQLQQSAKQTEQQLTKNQLLVDNKIADVMEQVNEISTTTETDWRLAEVEYLTRLASHRLNLARDIHGARQLLDESANILADLADPGLLPVRQIVAEDLAKVRAAARQDDTALYLRLKGLVPQVDTLPMYRQPQLASDGANAADATEGLNAWERFTHSFTRVATQYFQVRRNTNIKPLLSSEDETSLRQLIRLKLEQAAVALLQSKQQIYLTNLKQVHQHVSGNFLLDEQASKAFLAELDALLKANVDPSLPDISGSHQAISLFIERRHSLNLKKQVPPAKRAAKKPEEQKSQDQRKRQQKDLEKEKQEKKAQTQPQSPAPVKNTDAETAQPDRSNPAASETAAENETPTEEPPVKTETTSQSTPPQSEAQEPAQ